jgi:signal transduction histidine kinase
MKLLTKTTLYFITVSLFVFLLGGIAFYQLVRNSIRKNVDEELQNQMHLLISEMKSRQTDPESVPVFFGETVRFEKVDAPRHPYSAYSDTILHHSYKNQYEAHRSLSFYMQKGKHIYKVFLYKSLTEVNALIERLAVGLAALVLVFLFAILAINRFFFQKIWSDFFTTIKKIKVYDVNSKQEMQFPETEIIEFQQLNAVLDKMIMQIKRDYNELKEFTENLTHEIQTPLAVVKSKVELLLQKPDMNRKDSELIHSIYSQIISLSKLNKSLILITKIENNHFADNKLLILNELAHYHLSNFEDILDSKEIKVVFDEKKKCRLKADKNLLDILLINLIKNAIRHNVKGGEIRIMIDENTFKIANTGDETDMKPDELFMRYSFDSGSDASLGLGLTIVKKIIEYYKYQIYYSYLNQKHCVEIKF